MISESRLPQLLEPFGLTLTAAQVAQTLAYLRLLLRWNEKINLTAIRDPEEAATRHFGESLFIATQYDLRGSLLDIGTGAGFPGLALKIIYPELLVTLLEPVAKKRAFLKEAARVCGFTQVSIRAERLEDLIGASGPLNFDFATMRAVGNLAVLVPLAAKALKPAGKCLLWLSSEQGPTLDRIDSGLKWLEPIEMPISSTEIWCGEKP